MSEKPSVFDLTGELESRQKRQLELRSKKAVAAEIDLSFSEYDFSPELVEYQEVKADFEEFLNEIFKKAAAREFLRPNEREAFVVNLEIGFKKLYEAAQFQDAKRLAELSAGQEPAEFLASLESQINELNSRPIEDLTEEEIWEIERELNRLTEIGESFIASFSVKDRDFKVTFGGRGRSVLTEKELADHRDSVARFAKKTKEKFDARQTAEKIVDEYGKILVAHKISLGLEAKYTDEEILAHLREVSPVFDEKEILSAIKEGRKESKKGGKGQVGKIKTYFSIMNALFSGKKAEAAGFIFGALAIGASAPFMPIFFGEYIKTQETDDMNMAALTQIGSSVAQAELGYRLSGFLSDRVVGQGELIGKITSSVLDISPEGFSKTDITVLQQQINRTVESIQKAAEISVKDIGTDIGRVVSLGLSVSLRLGDPLLFIPIVIATGMNLIAARSGGEKIWAAQSEMNLANDKLTSSINETLSIKSSRGEEPGLQKEILARCYELRKNFNKAVRNFERAGGLPFATLLVTNAYIAKWRGLTKDEVVESVLSSNQLSSSLSNLTGKVFGLAYVLQPVADLINFVKEFSPEGGFHPENWAVELVDVELKGLQVPGLKIKPGDFCVVIGPSGSGKTTLFDVLTGSETERGLMQVDGHFWKGVDRKAYRKGLVVANQYYALETKSLKDNIVGESEFDQMAFEDGLMAFGLDQVLNKVAAAKAKKGRGEVSNPAKELIINSTDFKPSGGERKRMALLAIDYRLQTNPEGVHMIILDEPTEGCDSPTSKKIFKRIAEWRQKWPEKTILISSHERLMLGSLSEEARILGFDFATGKLVQDETLNKAKENSEAPFAQLFL